MILPGVELRVRAEAMEPVVLSELAGSALRGDFGASFRAVTCSTLAPTCKGCHLVRECAFPAFFASPAGRFDGAFAKQVDTPRRYAFDIADSNQTVQPGNAFEFGLRIVGSVQPYIPWIALAILEMGRRGVGSGRGRFAIREVVAGASLSRILSDGVIDQSALTRIEVTDLCDGIEQAVSADEITSIVVRFAQPTYLRSKNHGPFSPPSFTILIRAALRRLSSLAVLYGNRALVLPYERLILDSQRTTQRDATVNAVRTTRYSSRQYRRFPMEGIVGSVRYDGVPVWAMIVLRQAGWMGIGKMATHGLGRLEITQWANLSS